MSYLISFILAAVTFLASILLAVYSKWQTNKRKSLLSSFYIVMLGVAFTGILLFFPVVSEKIQLTHGQFFASLLYSIQIVFKMFSADCDFDFITENIVEAKLPALLEQSYIILSAILYALSPFLTVGAVLSFFANLTAHNKYLMHYFREVYIFSELNDRSLSLAHSLKSNEPKRTIIFTDVYNKEDEATFELIERAKELDAILFKNDITVVNFHTHCKKSKMYFFIIGSDEEENINQTAYLASKRDRKRFSVKKDYNDITNGYDYDRGKGDTRVYLFTDNFSSEQHLNSLKPDYIKIRRVNDVQSLIYQLIHTNGMEIFEAAKPTGKTVFNSATGEQDPQKKISAIIVGLGRHGTELTKALAWMAQMHPYIIEIDAFDANKNADKIFMSQYPELFDCNPIEPFDPEAKKYKNGDVSTPGEAHYTIRIHNNTDVTLYDFDSRIQSMTDTTYVFIALGNDDNNINCAVKIRRLLRRKGCLPVIHTVIYNDTAFQALEQSKSTLNITPFGGISTKYSESCVINSDLEKKALERHMKYTYRQIEEQGITGEAKKRMIKDGEESFWENDYNYRSSISSAIHSELKVKCGIPGADKTPDLRTEPEKQFIRNLEHCRWNAYVRSEGFVHSPTRDKIAKTHHLLVPFDKLPPSEQIKDDD